MPDGTNPTPYRIWPAQLAVTVSAAAAAAMAWQPAPPAELVASLAEPFAFKQSALFAPPVPSDVRHVVNKTAQHLRFYLHQIGATAVFADLDGDGLANDLCHNDARAKAVMVSPAPGTAAGRYEPFVLDFGGYAGPVTMYPVTCRAGDFNEDGLTDLLIGFAGRTPLLVLRRDLGEEAPSGLSNEDYVVRELIPGDTTEWSSTTITTSDIDGDGHVDLIIGNYFADGAVLYDPESSEPFEMNDSFSLAENGGTNRVMLWKSATSGAEPDANFVDAGDVFPGRSEGRWTLAIGAADLNEDGKPDLYFANDHGPDLLVYNQSTPGQVEFVPTYGHQGFHTPHSFTLGRDTFKGMGIDFADLNDDGVYDMFVSNIASKMALQEAHFLWMSTGEKPTPGEAAAPWVQSSVGLGVAYSGWSWETVFDDFDNNGQMELVQATGFIAGQHNRWADLQQFGAMNDILVKDPGNWTDVLENSDLDGSLPNPFYTRGPDGTYVDVSSAALPGVTPNGRGIATADVDGDGDLDMVFANHWQDSLYFENQAPHPGAFVGLHLLLPNEHLPAPPSADEVAGDPPVEGDVGVEDAAEPVERAEPSYRDRLAALPSVRPGHPAFREGVPAVGARVDLTLPDGRHLFREVDGGNGHSGARAPEIHLGLGAVSADTDIPLHVTWRDRQGNRHERDYTVRPGWHTLVLTSDEVNR